MGGNGEWGKTTRPEARQNDGLGSAELLDWATGRGSSVPVGRK